MELSELIEAVDILEYISQYTEFEEKNGEYWGLSPLQEENTPSFSVDAEKQCFYDFSSGKGGSVLTFILHYNNCSLREAEKILRAYIGDAGIAPAKQKMEATTVAKRYQRRARPRKESKSTVLPENYMERYEKRADKLAIWESEGISAESMSRFQVAYDGFSDRIVFPIRDIDGKIINVSGRTLDPQLKEKGLRKYTYFFPLGVLSTIYGIAENRSEIQTKSEVIIFEGAKSVLLANSTGIYNTAAILTSHLNSYQMKILAQLGVRVVFALDKGVVIREDSNIRRLKRYVTVEYLWDKDGLLDEKMSPIDAGGEVFQMLYEGRVPYR